MSPDAMLLADWAKSYGSCAVNHVPKEIVLEFSMLQHERNTIQYADREEVNLRFENGCFVSFMFCSLYDQDWHLPILDSWIDFQDLMAGDATSDATIGFVSLEEVL